MTDGKRNPRHKRFFYTVSTNFKEVLANSPNLPAKYGKVLNSQLYAGVISEPGVSSGVRPVEDDI